MLRRLLVCIIALSFIPNCAWYERKAGHEQARGKTYTKRVKGQQGTIPLEVKKPAGEELAMAATPQRYASLQVVAKGKAHLLDGNLEQALQTFQEAVTLDGSNGIAYYYIGRTNYELGNYEQALGLLERAESLLTDAQDWLTTINALREIIRLAAERQHQAQGTL